MAANIPNLSYTSGSSNRQTKTVDVVQTTDATPTVAYSIPIPFSSSTFAEVKFMVFDPVGFSQGAAGVIRGMLILGPTTPVVVGTDLSALNNFSAPAPSIAFVLNIPAKTADVTVTGKVGFTLHWHLEVTVFQNG